MNILLLSAGGGGGNILRSLKTLFARDVAIAQKTDAAYAARLRGAVTARFLDTNEFSLGEVPEEERLLIGAATTRGLGSRHDPVLAARALEESREEIEQLVRNYSIVVTIGTGGKGTGAGTMFPLAEIVRRQNKLVVPVFVRPSFERHEVDKRRYDHALHVASRFDQAGIRLIEILNDHAYVDEDPQPQAVVWERMNLPIARGLRGLIYVLWDLSQVDPSDLSILLAGNGRMRIGFGEIEPPEGQDPTEPQIREAVDACWQNPYCAFGKPAGTSLICIQGDWSNLADAKIKSGLATRALGGDPDGRYNPLYARAMHTPRPWGVTALFTEYTGAHDAIPLAWASHAADAHPPAAADTKPGRYLKRPAPAKAAMANAARPHSKQVAAVPNQTAGAASAQIATVVDLAKGLNRLDPVALDIAAGDVRPEILVDGQAVRKLVGLFWFRLIFPRLSPSWRERLLDALAGGVVIPNHVLSRGRHLSDCSLAELDAIAPTAAASGPAGPDLQLVLAVMQLWGEAARGRLRFGDAPVAQSAPRRSALFGWRR